MKCWNVELNTQVQINSVQNRFHSVCMSLKANKHSSDSCRFIAVPNIMALNPTIPSLQTAQADMWKYGQKTTVCCFLFFKREEALVQAGELRLFPLETKKWGKFNFTMLIFKSVSTGWLRSWLACNFFWIKELKRVYFLCVHGTDWHFSTLLHFYGCKCCVSCRRTIASSNHTPDDASQG